MDRTLTTADIRPIESRDELTALQDGDILAIVDSSDLKIKKISWANVKNILDIEGIENRVNERVEALEGDGEGSVSERIAEVTDPMKGEGWSDENLVDHEARIKLLRTELLDSRVSGYDAKAYETLGKRLDDIDRNLAQLNGLDPTKFWGLFYYEDTGTFERTGLAVGMESGRHDGAYDPYLRNDFDYAAPWAGIRRLKATEDGELLAYSDEPRYANYTDCEWLSEIGRVYVGLHRTTYNERPGTHFVVSMLPLHGLVANGFYGTDGKLLDKVYVGRTSLGTVDGAGYYSRPGTPPRVNTSYDGFTTGLANKSQTANWYLFDHAIHLTLVILMFIEFGGTNTKGLIGDGIQSGMPYSGTNASWALQADVVNDNDIIVPIQSSYKVGMLVQVGTAYSSQSVVRDRYIENIVDNGDSTLTLTLSGAPFNATAGSTCVSWGQPVPADQIDALGDGSGWIQQFDSSVRSHVCYRGIWDLWGNVWNWLGGILRNDMAIWLSFNRAKNNITTKAGIEGDEDWFYSGSTPNLASGYQKLRTPAMWDKGCSYLPEEQGGGSTTWLSAYLYYFHDEYMGIRAVLSGGVWTSGALVSPLFWDGRSTPAGTDFSRSGRAVIEKIV